MPYLTYEEYNDFGFSEIAEDEFNKNIKKASDIIDDVTSFFYQFTDLESDHKFRKTQFKKAVAAQVEYFNDLGASSSHGINSPLSFQAGRTQVSTGVANQKEFNSIVSKDVYMYLRRTGLLYRGVATRC